MVVSGARHVSKSTLVEALLADRADIVVLDPIADVEAARAEPERFLDGHRTPLVIE